MNNTLQSMSTWQATARPNPDAAALQVALGCHAEEFCEMLESLEQNQFVLNAWDALDQLAVLWKSGKHLPVIQDRESFLDSLADQIVTATGVGHCANMNIVEACVRVDASNWSKFVDGKPVFNSQGKIAKPDTYVPPNLEGLF